MHPATRGASLLILTVACVAVGALTSPSTGAGKPASASPEGFAATLVAPGVISTEADEVGAAFTPDMRTLYFTRRSPTTSTPTVSVIFASRFEKGRWGPPEVASFSGRYRDLSPAISPDGSRLFFFSYRPREPGGKPREDADLWVVDATDAARDRWSEPRNLGSPVNTDSNEGSPSVAADGTLYFSSDRDGGRGGFDIYRARPAGAGFAEPENLGEAINTGATETHPAIAPDQNLLVFVSFGRPEIPLSGGFPYPRGDLYASVRKDGVWEQARNLGPAVNTTATESNPSLAPDGRRLFFTSERGFGERADGGRADARTVPAGDARVFQRPGQSLRDPARARGPSHGWGERAMRAASYLRFLVGITVAGTLSLAMSPGLRRNAPATAEGSAAGEPRLFGEGVLSTPDDEFGGTLSPDGQTFLYCKSVPRSQFYVIVESRRKSGRWSSPRVAPFSGRYRDSDPVFSRDGSRVYFVSDRPVGGVDRKNYDVWSVPRRGEVWGEPENLGPPINSDKNEYFVSFTRDGTIYFTSAREGSRGPIDVWRSRLEAGRYAEPENLGEAINRKEWLNVEAWIAEDESFLLVGAFGHADGAGDSDIFVSYRKDGTFGPPRPLGPSVNTPAREYSPRISLDGRRLFFTSERGMPTQARSTPWTAAEFRRASGAVLNGLGNIYETDLEAALAGTR